MLQTQDHVSEHAPVQSQVQSQAQSQSQAGSTGSLPAASLGGYRTMLEKSFVLQDHRKLRDIPHLVLSDRVQHQYPGFVANVVERMFRVDNPVPKPGLRRIVREERKRAGIRLRDLLRDGRTGLKGFG